MNSNTHHQEKQIQRTNLGRVREHGNAGAADAKVNLADVMTALRGRGRRAIRRRNHGGAWLLLAREEGAAVEWILHADLHILSLRVETRPKDRMRIQSNNCINNYGGRRREGESENNSEGERGNDRERSTTYLEHAACRSRIRVSHCSCGYLLINGSGTN